MDAIVNRFEKITVYALLVMMMIYVGVTVVELGIIIVQQLLEPPFMLFNILEMKEVLGFFLMVLIGLELLESVKAYLLHHDYKIEIVLLVALIAISRKIIILEYKETDALNLLGIAALILALSVGWYLIKTGTLKADKAVK